MAASEREETAGILIREFLRPQEALRSVVEAREHVTNRSDASSRRMSSGASTVRSRVLAVVTNDASGIEEGWYTSVHCIWINISRIDVLFVRIVYLSSKWSLHGMN